MYLVKSHLKNNGKDYKPGDYIEPNQLTEGDIKALLDLGVISPNSELRIQNSRPRLDMLSNRKHPSRSELAQKLLDSDNSTVKETGDTNSELRILNSELTEILAFVNSADVKDLTKIKGVGNATAKAIASHRETNGLFSSVEELDRLIPNVDWNNVTYDF